METFLKDKNTKGAVVLLIMVICAFTFIKFINEIKTNQYIGREYQYSNTISVNGEGEVTAVSDIATLSINLSKDGATAKEAQTLLNESITKTLSYLKEQKIEDKDIKSEYGGLNPKYESSGCMYYPCPVKEPKIVGYTATQSITVKVREVDSASTIRTGLATIGVTDISGPTFSIDDEDAFKAEARALAIEDAKAKAKILAKDLGVKLGKIVSFNEEGERAFPMYAKEMSSVAMGMMDSAAPAPTLPKGENKITSNVSITFVIK